MWKSLACVLATAAWAGMAGSANAEVPRTNGPAKAVGSGWSAEVSPDGTTAITLDQDQQKAVQKVSDYFNYLKSLQGDFIQTGADEKVMRGRFKMMQPGRFRFDYNRPSRQIIISDGTYLAIQDLDLRNEDRVSLDQTPFRVLLRKDVDLIRDARIIAVQETDGKIQIALRDKSPDSPGLIKLVLVTQPETQLEEWVTTDAQGLDTRVQVGNLKRDEEISADQFVIKSVTQPFNQ